MNNCHEDIFEACKTECLICIQKYIKDIHKKTNNGYTPLHWALNNGYTPLHWASNNGHDKCVELLLKNGVTHEKNNYGDTPLLLASQNGHDKCVKLLLKNGGTNEKNNDGYTPLHLASRYGYDKCIEILLKYGAFQNGYNSGFTQEELKQYIKPVYVENLNNDDWQTETIFYLVNSELNFNLTCDLLELLFYWVLKK